MLTLTHNEVILNFRAVLFLLSNRFTSKCAKYDTCFKKYSGISTIIVLLLLSTLRARILKCLQSLNLCSQCSTHILRESVPPKPQPFSLHESHLQKVTLLSDSSFFSFGISNLNQLKQVSLSANHDSHSGFSLQVSRLHRGVR